MITRAILFAAFILPSSFLHLQPQARDFRAQRIVLDDDGAGGGFNSITLQTPSLTTNYRLTLPTAIPAGAFLLRGDSSGALIAEDPTTLVGRYGWSRAGNTSATGDALGSLNLQPLSIITNGLERMRVGAGGGIAVGTTTIPSSTMLAIGGIPVSGGTGIRIDLAGTMTSTGMRIEGVGTGGANDAGLAIDASASGVGAAIRVGGATRPATGVDARANDLAVRGRALTGGSGVVGLTLTSAAAMPTPPAGSGVFGQAAFGTNGATGYGLYGESIMTGSGDGVRSYGAFGRGASTGAGTNNGVAVGVFGTATTAGVGRNAAIGGYFTTSGGSTVPQFAIVASGGGDVYLGSTDAGRPTSLTTGWLAAPLGAGNANTTFIHRLRMTGGLVLPLVKRNVDDTLNADDLLVVVDASATPITITLPPSPDAGRMIVISAADASNAVTVDGNGRNIDGVPGQALTTSGEDLMLVFDGSEWRDVSR